MIDEYEESKDERATRERDMEALRIENAELRAENLALRHKLDRTASAEEEALILHARPVQVAGRDMPVLITTATAYHSFNGDNGGNGNNGNNGPDLGYGPAHAAHAAPAASAPPAYREVIGRDALTGSGGGAVEGDLAFARQLRESEDARIAREQQEMYRAMELERNEANELAHFMARDEENRMLLRAIGAAARMCPACGTVIERASGDHQMMCGCVGRPAGGTMDLALRNGGCGHEFHYDTLAPLPNSDTGKPGQPCNDRQWKFRHQGR